jgi:hypothetical protein
MWESARRAPESRLARALRSTAVMRRKALLGGGIAVWLAAAAAGFAMHMRYERRPGAAAPPAASAPEGLPDGVDRPAIVLVLHPRCPCSRGTIDAVATIVTKAGRPVDVAVVFVGPADWPETPFYAAAREIPGCRVLRDEGALARRLGARTSGQAYVYAGGRLAFSGGLTSGRGQSASGAALGAVLGAIGDGEASPCGAPVYGCPLGIEEDRR